MDFTYSFSLFAKTIHSILLDPFDAAQNGVRVSWRVIVLLFGDVFLGKRVGRGDVNEQLHRNINLFFVVCFSTKMTVV